MCQCVLGCVCDCVLGWVLGRVLGCMCWAVYVGLCMWGCLWGCLCAYRCACMQGWAKPRTYILSLLACPPTLLHVSTSVTASAAEPLHANDLTLDSGRSRRVGGMSSGTLTLSPSTAARALAERVSPRLHEGEIVRVGALSFTFPRRSDVRHIYPPTRPSLSQVGSGWRGSVCLESLHPSV